MGKALDKFLHGPRRPIFGVTNDFERAPQERRMMFLFDWAMIIAILGSHDSAFLSFMKIKVIKNISHFRCFTIKLGGDLRYLGRHIPYSIPNYIFCRYIYLYIYIYYIQAMGERLRR